MPKIAPSNEEDILNTSGRDGPLRLTLSLREPPSPDKGSFPLFIRRTLQEEGNVIFTHIQVFFLVVGNDVKTEGVS